MYSYEDRIKAVRLYLKLGKRLGVTIRQLGYPTKNTLIGWSGSSLPSNPFGLDTPAHGIGTPLCKSSTLFSTTWTMAAVLRLP